MIVLLVDKINQWSKRMQLSKRLQAVADYVSKGNKVADIGCDHAYTSIYLMEQGIAAHVYALDVNKGPIKRAIANVKNYGFQDDIDIRLSDGAKELKEGEADTILIAGMGGSLMARILDNSKEVVSKVKEIILQPQSEIFIVRRYLHSIGFQIVAENMVIDDSKYYVMMKAIKGEESYDREVQYQYGKLLLEEKHPILKELLEKEYKTNLKILKQLESRETESAVSRVNELKEELQYIIEGMKYYE